MQKPEASRISSTLNVLPQNPYQPVNIKYPKTKMDHQQAFQPAWYSQFSWLHYLPSSDSIICHTCATANLKGLLHLDTRSESSFLSDGFRNWKNALCKNKGFRKHERSLCHKHAVTQLTQPGHIDEQLKEQLKSQKEENRNCLLKIIQSISYLARQGIALRKGKQEEESNFKQLLLLQAEDDKVLQRWIGNSYDKHFSSGAQNEILQIMALKVLRGIASDIAESGYYSIMADETTDANNIEQLVICIRWVDKEMTVHEV